MPEFHNKEQNQEETIDIKAILFKYLRYWHYFLLSFLFFFFLGTLNNRYTIPEYSVSSTLLIRDDSNTQLGAENLLEGLELFSGKKNLKNEIIILNSYSNTEKVIKELGLGLSYFQHGFFQTNELFENTPFKIIVDSSHVQLTGVEYELEIINENQFQLSVSAEDHFPCNLKTEKLDKTLLGNINIDKTFEFDQKISNLFFSFIIQRTPSFNLDNIIDNEKTFSFKLHQTNVLAQKLIREITINPINKETSILKLNIKGRTPKKSIQILNKLTEVYIRNSLDEKNLMAINTIYFIDEQLAVIKDSLTLIENQLEIFRKQNPNLDIVNKDFGTYFQKQELDNTLSEQSVNIKYYQSLLSYLKDDSDAHSIVSPTLMGISNPELNGLIHQLLQLDTKKDELQLTTTAKNPAYKAVLSQIKHTKNTIIENVRNLISSALIYEKDLKVRINSFNNKIYKLPELEKSYLILKRKHEYNEQTSIYLQQKRYEASLAKAGTESDHKVIDPARLDSEKPTTPNKGLTYFFALLFGLICPIAYISLKEFFSDTISSKSDLQNGTDVPILGLIGHSEKEKSLVVNIASKSIIAESFRTLRTNIQYLAAHKDNKIITITSSIGGEGKTFVAMNLAGIFALSGHKTILIGGDLRKPKLHKDFNVNESKGLSSYLIHKSSLEEVIEKTKIESLDVIGSGPTPPNPAELLDSQSMQELITKLNKTYDYIIIDTPPIGLVTDGAILMRYADISLYVVRHNYTKRNMLGAMNNLFDQNHIKNMHIIINDFEQARSLYGYGYDGYGYDGYGYGYGSDGYGYYEEEKKS